MMIMAEIGEYSKGRHVELTPVEYAGTIAAGDPLKVSGVAADGTPKVVKATGTDAVRFFAVQNGGGVSGEVKNALMRGFIYVGGTGKVALVTGHGVGLGMVGGKIATANSSGNKFGWNVSGLAADGEGWIYFNPDN